MQKDTPYHYVVGWGDFCTDPLEPDPTIIGQGLNLVGTILTTLG
jgi:hypothetical protein